MLGGLFLSSVASRFPEAAARSCGERHGAGHPGNDIRDGIRSMSSGLEGVVAAQTVLSHTDSEQGMVWVRGVSLPRLVAEHGFEGTIALLWNGFAGEGLTRDGIHADFGAARQVAFDGLDQWLDRATPRPLFEGIRRCLAVQPDDSGPAALVGALSVGVPALLRARQGAMPVAPDRSLSTAADLLRMLHDKPAALPAVAALDTYFTVMAESGLSGSSFTARIVASTHASLAAAVLGAWCAFTGPLHGGAPGPTLDMLDAAEAEPDLEAWLETRLLAGERLMGFGHRVFRGNDPRAEAMRQALQRMGPAAGRLAFATRLEQAVATAIERVKPGRRLPPNVEIMAALLLDAVGVPRTAFTPVFAVGRSAGWIAHALEQRKTGRMIRPTSRYVGEIMP
jgi:citrate synthase